MNKTDTDTQRKIELCQKKNAITIAGVMGGECVFNLKTRGGAVKKCILNGDILLVDGQKQYRLTKEQVARFKEAEENFNRDCVSAKHGDGFVSAECDGCRLYVRISGDGQCQFIFRSANGDIVQFRDRIPYFLHNMRWNYRNSDCETQYKSMCGKMEKLLLLCRDDYISREIRYSDKLATREEVDFLIRSDGKPRFFVGKSEYGVDEIHILSVRKRPRSPLHPYDLYIFSFETEGMTFDGYYGGKGKNIASVADEGASPDIVISDELANMIRAVGDKKR